MADRIWKSTHRYARISSRKARLVTQLIADKPVNDALDLLRFTRKRASVLVDKVLRAAMADADEQDANVRNLYIHAARVDEGPTIKRFRPKDRGRAHPIMKRTSHIVVAVGEGRRK